ncbi:MAG: T9SS type A sorting domain-containing protein, partial [Ignavibacteria bacterium]
PVWFSPNPANDVLTIRSESVGSVSILDLQGRVVLSVDIAQGATSLPIDVLSQGSYIVRFSSSNVVKSSRLSVQR